MKTTSFATLLASAPFLLCCATARAVVLGQLDDFENGTTLGWANGLASDPQNIASGGPLGANDNYLQLTADGSGSGGKLTAFNRAHWLGDYLAAGVSAIELDLKGFSSLGSQPLAIRLVLKPSTSGNVGYVSTIPFTLAIDGAWHHAVFNLSEMTAVGSPGSLAELLANPLDFRIVNASFASTQGDTLVGQMGIDNIRAVPEPSASGLALLGAGLLGLRRRGRWVTAPRV